MGSGKWFVSWLKKSLFGKKRKTCYEVTGSVEKNNSKMMQEVGLSVIDYSLVYKVDTYSLALCVLIYQQFSTSKKKKKSVRIFSEIL